MKKVFNRYSGRLLGFLAITSILLAYFPLVMVWANPGTTGTPDTSWYTANPSLTAYTITNADQLAGLAVIVNAVSTGPFVTESFATEDFAGKVITLGNDIDLTVYGTSGSWHCIRGFWGEQKGWRPIGYAHGLSSDAKSFAGTFDGKNNKITGLYVETKNISTGLFGSITGTIKNVNVIDAIVKSEDCMAGGLSGRLVYGGTIENSSVTGNIYGNKNINNHPMAGGIAGYIFDNSNVINCVFKGNVNSAAYAGGIAGNVNKYNLIKNCFTDGEIIGDGNGTFAGGIAGFIWSSSVINNNTTALVRGDTAGGIVGRATVLGNDANTITGNTALSPIVEGVTKSARVVGSTTGYVPGWSYESILSDNHALATMSHGGGVPFPTPASVYNVHDNLNGANYDLTAFELVASKEEGLRGGTVDITVSLLNNSGIAGFSIDLEFDTTYLSLVSITPTADYDRQGSTFQRNMNLVNNNEFKTVRVVWGYYENVPTAPKFVLRFEISNEAPLDGITIPIVIKDNFEIRDENRVLLSPTIHNGEVRVADDSSLPGASDLWGDVTDTNEVDIFDLILLAQYLSDPNMPVSANGLRLADVTTRGSGGNTRNVADLIWLAQYLASSSYDPSQPVPLP